MATDKVEGAMCRMPEQTRPPEGGEPMCVERNEPIASFPYSSAGQKLACLPSDGWAVAGISRFAKSTGAVGGGKGIDPDVTQENAGPAVAIVTLFYGLWRAMSRGQGEEFLEKNLPKDDPVVAKALRDMLRGQNPADRLRAEANAVERQIQRIWTDHPSDFSNLPGLDAREANLKAASLFAGGAARGFRGDTSFDSSIAGLYRPYRRGHLLRLSILRWRDPIDLAKLASFIRTYAQAAREHYLRSSVQDDFQAKWIAEIFLRSVRMDHGMTAEVARSNGDLEGERRELERILKGVEAFDAEALSFGLGDEKLSRDEAITATIVREVEKFHERLGRIARLIEKAEAHEQMAAQDHIARCVALAAEGDSAARETLRQRGFEDATALERASGVAPEVAARVFDALRRPAAEGPALPVIDPRGGERPSGKGK